MELLTTTHHINFNNVLCCFDRIILTGTLPQICYAYGMTSYLYLKGVRIFNYAHFTESFKDELRTYAEQQAKDNGIEIEFIAKSHIQKEDLVKKVLDKRGTRKGLVHII